MAGPLTLQGPLRIARVQDAAAWLSLAAVLLLSAGPSVEHGSDRPSEP